MSRVALLLALVLAGTARANVQYYGYAASAAYDVPRFSRFTNFGAVGIGDDPADPNHTQMLAALSARGKALVVNIGGVLWDRANGYRTLYPDWSARLDTYLATNASYLSRVIAVGIHDEVFWNHVDMAQFDWVAPQVRARFPAGVKMWLVEAAPGVGNDAWSSYTGSLPSVDWIGIDYYGVHPNGSAYASKLQALRNRFGYRPTIYVMDGFWNDAHQAWYGTTDKEVLVQVAQEYSDVANADPYGVILGIFHWDYADGTNPVATRSLPCSIRRRHAQIGRQILGLTYNSAYPTGYVGGFDSWGCLYGYVGDPDASECEPLTVANCTPNACYYDAREVEEGVRDYRYGDTFLHRFTWCPQMSIIGVPITTWALDTSGYPWRQMATQCRDNPTCTYYPNARQPIGYLDGIDANGYAFGWTCDPDAPLVSSQVQFWTDWGWVGPYTTTLGNEQAVTDLCGGGYSHRFGVYLPYWTRGMRIYAYGVDLTSGTALLPGWTCAATYPACTW